MFLKRLEIIGFKSFADRVGIDFVPGVTAVVGPNGSGKSNVLRNPIVMYDLEAVRKVHTVGRRHSAIVGQDD
ncbi:MAG: AAA family ATPase, partial [Psychrobacillus sp.]